MQETALDRLLAALPKIQNLHSLQCENFNLGISGSSGLRKSHTERRERNQKIRLEFSCPADGFKHYTFCLFSGFRIRFLSFSIFFFDFPMESKKDHQSENNQSLKRKKSFCFFLKMCRVVSKHTKPIFTPFHHYSCYN